MAELDRQLEQIARCGMNTVVIWPAAFWWEEPSDEYPFRTGKEILRMAREHGLKIIMELAGQSTCFEYAPDFRMKPEYYAVDAHGHNYFHPEVKSMVCDHFTRVALAYKDFPALLGYDIFNETMYRSFDPYTLSEFRLWLREKYGTLRRLNEVWERTYGDWEQVGPEIWNWMSIMPAADFNAFRRDSIARFLVTWRDAVRSVDPDHLILADNIHSMASPVCQYDRPQDDYGLKSVCDEIGMSFYPKQNNGSMEQALRWEVFDAFYAASGREGFWISEMQTHIQALFNAATSVRPDELRTWCLEGYAAGAKSLIYWMWRPFTSGAQVLGRGIVDVRGEPTERYYLASELSELFLPLGPLKPVRSRVGILFDPICDDFQRLFSRNYGLDDAIYLQSLFGAYKAMLQGGVRCDIIRTEELSHYRAVILSNHLVVDRKTARALRRFAEGGGVIIADGRFGMLDEFATANKALPGGEFNECVGAEFTDFDNERTDFTYHGVSLSGCFGRQLVRPTAGRVAASFSDGRPAVIENKVGSGLVITVQTAVFYGCATGDSSSAAALSASLADAFGLRRVESRLPLRFRISESDDRYVLFAFNDSDGEQRGEVTVLLDEGRKSLRVCVPPHDAAAIQIEKQVFVNDRTDIAIALIREKDIQGRRFASQVSGD